MAERKLIVQVVGDASSYEKALKQATQSTESFGRRMQQIGAKGTLLDQFSNRERIQAGIENVRRSQAQLSDALLGEADAQNKVEAARARSTRSLAAFGGVSVVAFQALRHISDGLKTTGDAAFTTEGRIRNLGAALASGDIVGGLQAITAQESRIAPDLEKAVAALRQMRDESSRISLKDVVGDTQHFRSLAAQATKDMIAIGIPIDEAKTKTAAWVTELQNAAGTTTDLGGTFETIFGRINKLLEEATKKAIAARKGALEGLAQLPPGISAAISREAGPQGTEAGQLDVLAQADANLLKRIRETRTKGTGRDVSEALARLQSERKSINDQIEGILKQQDQRRLDALAEAERKRKEAADRLAAAIQAQREAFSRMLGFLEIRLDRARATAGLRDDLRALQAQEKAVLAQIAIEGRTVELERKLLTIEQQRAAVSQQRKEIAEKQRQANQFRRLGLTAEGDKPTPTIENLTKQLEKLDQKVTGGQNQALLNAIRKVLLDPIDTATVETRAKIRDLFATIRSELDQGGKGPLTSTSGLNTKKILEGLGLDAAAEAELRSRLSGFNSAGRALAPRTTQSNIIAGAAIGIAAGPIVVESHTTINLDGDQIAKTVTRNQQKQRRRNPQQKRGPNRIGGV